jgi:phospholipid/cholesterol/gamma-HCH transport system permease protein
VGFGILASVIIGTQIFDVPFAYWNFHLEARTEMIDIIIAMIKGTSFGMLIVLISCHQGLKASNGAVGVGRGTTNAMVFSSLAILIVNFFLTMLLNIFFPISFGS